VVLHSKAPPRTPPIEVIVQAPSVQQQHQQESTTTTISTVVGYGAVALRWTTAIQQRTDGGIAKVIRAATRIPEGIVRNEVPRRTRTSRRRATNRYQ
jgi:hypothetical protein